MIWGLYPDLRLRALPIGFLFPRASCGKFRCVGFLSVVDIEIAVAIRSHKSSQIDLINSTYFQINFNQPVGDSNSGPKPPFLFIFETDKLDHSATTPGLNYNKMI